METESKNTHATDFAGTQSNPFREEGAIKCENPADDKKPTQVAIALHFVEQFESKGKLRQAKSAADNVFTSMELDLLAYQFQLQDPQLRDPRPIRSHCTFQGPRDLYIEYRSPYCYKTEGSKFWRRGKSQVEGYSRLKTRVMLSYTEFDASRIRVWHVVLTPAKPGYFDEFDIIKLIHLYDGRTEATELHEHVRFRLDGPTAEEFKGAELLERLGAWDDARSVAMSGKNTKDRPFTAGTIQICLPHEHPVWAPLNKILKARTDSDAPADFEKLQAGEKSMLLAIGGIVTGIFDFERVDAEELLDTLAPTFTDGRIFLRMNRCSLIGLTPDDRVLQLQTVQEGIGISPYLLLPHAAIIHNETLVRRAESTLKSEVNPAIEAAWLPFFDKLTQALSPPLIKPLSLTELERKLDEAERDLGQLQLRNIFNYHTERTLFEKGMEMRGAIDKRETVLAQHKGAAEEVELLWKVRDGWGQVWHAAFVSLLSALAVRPLLEDLKWPSWLLYVVMALLFGGIVLFRSRGLKKKSSRRNDKAAAFPMQNNRQELSS